MLEREFASRTSTGGATIQDSEARLAIRAGLHSNASSSSSVSIQNISVLTIICGHPQNTLKSFEFLTTREEENHSRSLGLKIFLFF